MPVVPRYGSVGASGDLMPSAYIARVLMGMGEVNLPGPPHACRRGAATAPASQTVRFAPKEGLALINGTTGMTAFAALLWMDAWRVLRALLGAVALAIEALEAPSEPYRPWVHESKGHPGQIAVAAHVLRLARRQRIRHRIAHNQKLLLAALRAARARPRLGSAGAARAVIEREDQFGQRQSTHRSGNRQRVSRRQLLRRPYLPAAGHLKLDFAIEANWAMRCSRVLVDDKFNGGLPANLVPEPGINSGFKGMQLSITSLTCAIRQMAGPSSIHSLPTEQYNQDVVSLGMHSAVTAAMPSNVCATRRRWCCWPPRKPSISAAGRRAWAREAGACMMGAPVGCISGSRPAHGRRHRRGGKHDSERRPPAIVIRTKRT